jgi:hypothetical protein
VADRSRLIVRRERAHPGAQLSFTDHDGDRLPSRPDRPNRPPTSRSSSAASASAHAEDHIRNDKDTGLRNMPFRDFEHNRVC